MSSVREVFQGDESQILDAYVLMLHRWSQVHNLTAEKSKDAIYQNLIQPSLSLDSVLSKYGSLIDLGTGAGIPGMVLAILRPGQHWVLVEKSTKKRRFLKYVVSDLALQNVTVFDDSFEKMPFDSGIDAVVSRGSAKLFRQIDLTSMWRENQIPLYSVQTEKSLDGYNGEVELELIDLPGVKKQNGLVLVKVK